MITRPSPLTAGPEVIKGFSCSTQLSMKFVLLMNLKLLAIANSFLLNIPEHENFSANKYENANCCWHFHIYYQRKFHAQLSWAWKKFYNLGGWSEPLLSTKRIIGYYRIHEWRAKARMILSHAQDDRHLRIVRMFEKKAREKSRECHNHKPQPFPDTLEEEETDRTKQAQIKQTFEKH